jgi:hypothetical protein
MALKPEAAFLLQIPERLQQKCRKQADNRRIQRFAL